MRFNKTIPLLISLILLLALGSSCKTPAASPYDPLPTASPTPSPTPWVPANLSPPSLTDTNVMQVTVNGSLCNSATSVSYPNKPCVSVTVCTPGSTTSCQVINDLLLDTGSYGLRVFKSALTVPLTKVTDSNSKTITECATFGDGSKDWGPVELADVKLGNENAVTVPIQVMDSTFVGEAANCALSDTGPSAAGFNGILGVGLQAYDCGITCVTRATTLYYACGTTTCASSTVPLANQVQNPVALLPLDNNGLILELPSVADQGAASASGFMVLGIGTRTNNSASGVTTFPANQSAEFSSVWSGVTYSKSFIDSGSNAIYATSPAAVNVATCAGSSAGWYCPTSQVTYNVANVGVNGPPVALSFNIANFLTLANSGNYAFNNLVGLGDAGRASFDWGLPFFFNKNVFVGINGTSSNLGLGPYWAY